MISGQRSLVRGRVTEAGEFLEIAAEGLRSLVARDAELSEIFMRAFILRRLALITRGQGNVILMGSRHLRTRYACASFSAGTRILTPTLISTRTRHRRNFWTVLKSSRQKFRWSFVTVVPCCVILPLRKSQIAWGSTPASITLRCGI